MWTFTPPFANLDSLALGGILAYTWAAAPSLRGRLVWVGGWLGIPLVIGLSILSVLHMSLGMVHAVFEYTIWAMFFVWLIDGAGRGFGGITGRVLELRPLLYLGQISYGLYVFHPLVIGLARWSFARLGQPYPQRPAIMFVFLVAGTIVIAACSWHFFERPLNDLKRRFDVARSVEAGEGVEMSVVVRNLDVMCSRAGEDQHVRQSSVTPADRLRSVRRIDSSHTADEIS